MNNELPDTIHRLFPEQELHPKTVDDVMNQSSFLDKIKAYETVCSQSFDTMPSELQDALILPRLQQLFNTLWINPLWRERLRNHEFLSYPSSFEAWQSLPITDRDTLHNFYMGKRPGQVVPLSRGGFEVVASGGTSGGLPIETVYSLKELRDTYSLAGAHMDKYIFQHHFPKDRPSWVIMTLADNDMWSSGTMIGGVLQCASSTNFIAAGPMSEIVYNHILSFEGNKAIMGMSREIEPLVELGAKVPLEHRNSFKLAIYGSGLLQNRKVTELKTIYPNLQILSYFASNQAEAIGLQHDPGDYLIAVPGLHFIEIVDDQGRWVDEGEEGELVITRLHASEAPVLRMQLGDRMIRRPNKTTNSLNAFQMEFAGRSSDIIHIGESHYSATRVLSCLHQAFSENGMNIDAKAIETQFFNDRVNRHLTWYATTEDAGAMDTLVHQSFADSKIRAIFIEALKQALPLYDQNESHFKALDNVVYTFEIRIVPPESPKIYRTKVNKVPLIKDRI
jgi:phenylacetate-CoA ligase